MIRFHEIKYKNFLSGGNKPLVFQLDRHPVTRLSGLNGSGKSALTDAITFALFNKPFRKINKPQLLNNMNKANLEVQITFTTNNKEYRIVRGMKPTIFEIYEDGHLLNQDSAARDYQDYLETAILKMNYKAFTQIVIIGHATYMPFMKLTPAERRIVIENILDIDIFSKMNVILKQKVSAIKEDINDVSYQYDLAKEKIKIHSDNLTNSRASIEAKIEENDAQISALQTQLKIKQNNIQIMNEEVDQILNEDLDVASIKTQLSKLSEYEITFKSKLKNINKELKFFKENDVCSTCHQNIDEDFKADILAQREADSSKFMNGVKKTKKEIEKLETALDQAQAKIDKVAKIRLSISQKTVELSYLEKEILRISEESKSLAADKSSDIKALEKEYTLLWKQTQSLLDERDNLLLSQHINSLAGVLLKDDGIKTKIIRNYLPTMNKLINKYLGMMDFYVNFNLDENFEEVIKLANKENFTYFSFSEGEKLRIDLAILFTWREIAKLRNSANTNLLILDEVFDSSLDSTGIDDFLKIINSFGKNTNIFIISHKEEILSDRFTNTIKFEKVKGFTKIT